MNFFQKINFEPTHNYKKINFEPHTLGCIMNYILWCAGKDLGIFFTFFYCTEKNIRQTFAAQKISWAGILGDY